MKSLCICILLFILQDIIAQNISHNLVAFSVESEIFKKEFTICKSDSNIIFFDKTNTIDSLDKFRVCNVQINVSHDSAYSKFKPSSYYDDAKTKYLIIFYDIVKKGNYYTVYFWRPYSGANLEFTIRINRKKPILIKYRVSTF